MAFLEDFNFTGRLGEFSAYRMKGSKKIVIRKKGGASKEKIKNSPAFATPRKYMSEFGGCSSMGKLVRRTFGNQAALADYNISGPINALLKVVQKQDTVSALGKRNIELSKHPGLLEGFSFNVERPFDSIVRNPIAWSIDRATHSAQIDIPQLIPGANFFPQNSRPMFCFAATLGIVPDFFFSEQYGAFQPGSYEMGWGIQQMTTEWLPVTKGMDALTLELEEPHTPPDDAYTLVLSIGIRFGMVYGGNIIGDTPRLGAAKVLGAR